MTLITSPNLEAPDEFYEALIECHRGLSDEASHALNARLVLLLANQVGSLQILKQALDAARAGATEPLSPAHAPAGPR